MSKGKYANASEKRREHEGLEQRVAKAERERDRLAAELADEKAGREIEVTHLREAVKSLRTQRDEAVSPDLRQASETVLALRAEAEVLRKEKAQILKTNKRLANIITSAAVGAGFRTSEASVAWIGALDPDDYTTLKTSDKAKEQYKKGNREVEAIQYALQHGFKKDELADALFGFYRALADHAWRRDGTAFVIDNWFLDMEGAKLAH